LYKKQIIESIDIESIKNEVLSDLKSVNRPGINNVIDFIISSDYLYAPASSNYHLSCPNGLLIHSYNVKNNFELLSSIYNPNIEKDSIYLLSYLHDICKCNCYIKTVKNVKIRNKWIQIDGYKYNKEGIQGHGDLSVIMLLQMGLALTDTEISAIQMHMGAFHFYHTWEMQQQLNTTYSQYDEALLLHISDMISSYRTDVYSEIELSDDMLLASKPNTY